MSWYQVILKSSPERDAESYSRLKRDHATADSIHLVHGSGQANYRYSSVLSNFRVRSDQGGFFVAQLHARTACSKRSVVGHVSHVQVSCVDIRRCAHQLAHFSFTPIRFFL